VEDHDDTRDLLRRTLARQPDFAVLDDFTDAESALSQIPARLPAVLLVDWHLGEDRMNGIEFIGQAKPRFPGICYLLLTAYDLDHLPAAAVRCGADGFLYKSDPLAKLPARIRAALAGQFPCSAKAIPRLVASLRAESPAPAPAEHLLNPREREILHHLGSGRTAKETALLTHLSEHTVTTYRKSAFKKLSVHKLPEALNKLRGGGQKLVKRPGAAP
jgi:DNA-binding NarL/FixJ family response regulator